MRPCIALAQTPAPAPASLTGTLQLDRWVVNATGFTAPKDASGNDAVYEVTGVTTLQASSDSSCDLHIDNHSNPADSGTELSITDPQVPFVIRSGDSISTTGGATCIMVLTVLEGYPMGQHP